MIISEQNSYPVKSNSIFSRAFLVNTLNPEKIVLGGGLSNSKHYKQLNKLTNQFVFPNIQNTFKIVKHQISDYAGIVGAATLTFK